MVLHTRQCRTQGEYDAAMLEYRAIVAAMEAEEAAARRASAPGPCGLCAYWCQQLVALSAEVPLRLLTHCCCAGCGCVAAAACGVVTREPDNAAAACFEHHARALDVYASMARFLASNLCEPCDPVYVYTADVALERPPPPVPPPQRGGGRCCDECCQPCARGCCESLTAECAGCCDAEKFASLTLRAARSLLCVLSGPEESCHPTRVCGPCCALGECEPEGSRLQRWSDEYDAALAARTDRFYAANEGSRGERYVFFEAEGGGLRAAIVPPMGARGGRLGRGGPRGDVARGTRPPRPARMAREASEPPAGGSAVAGGAALGGGGAGTGGVEAAAALKLPAGGGGGAPDAGAADGASAPPPDVLEGVRPLAIHFDTPEYMRERVQRAARSARAAAGATTPPPPKKAAGDDRPGAPVAAAPPKQPPAPGKAHDAAPRAAIEQPATADAGRARAKHGRGGREGSAGAGAAQGKARAPLPAAALAPRSGASPGAPQPGAHASGELREPPRSREQRAPIATGVGGAVAPDVERGLLQWLVGGWTPRRLVWTASSRGAPAGLARPAAAPAAAAAGAASEPWQRRQPAPSATAAPAPRSFRVEARHAPTRPAAAQGHHGHGHEGSPAAAAPPAARTRSSPSASRELR